MRLAKLKMAFNQAKDRQAILQEDAKVTSAWFKLVDKTKAKYGVYSHDVHNFDKTDFQMGINGTMKTVAGAKRCT
jgi:spore germination protein YaaH